MLSLINVGYEVGGRWLFQHASWTLSPGQQIGLVGRNGAGKSTLLRIITGQLSPTEGEVNRQRGLKIGFFTQDLLEFESHEPIFEVCLGAFHEQLELKAKIDALLVADPEAQATEAWLHELSDAQDRFLALGGYEMEARVHEVLAGLGFATDAHARPFSSFSGGWRMRVMLAKLLLGAPDILLLDEPTNHLDLPAIEWLEAYLQRFPGSSVTISHDREFLDRMVTEVVEISSKRLHFFTGNYSKYEVQKAERRVLHQAAFDNQQKMIADTEDFINRFRAKATKASQAQSRVKMLEKLERVEAPEPDDPEINFKFAMAEEPGRDILHIQNLTKRYGDLEVLHNANCHLMRGDKVGLVGPNGIGKSTLLRILEGSEPFQGQRSEGIRVKMAVFAQHQLESLNPDNTIFEELKPFARERGDTFVRTVLGGFMFSGDSVDKSISVLSGGERARVALARTLLSEANVLLLDEPTNHLDIPSVEVLIRAMQRYEGTLVVISHNRHFLRSVTNKVWFIEDKQMKEFPGSYAEFEGHKAMRLAEARAKEAAPANQPPASPKPAQAPQPAKQPTNAPRAKLPPDPKVQKQLQNKLKKLEADIAQAETLREQLKAEIVKPEFAADFGKLGDFQKKIDAGTQDIERLMAEWEQVAVELE